MKNRKQQTPFVQKSKEQFNISVSDELVLLADYKSNLIKTYASSATANENRFAKIAMYDEIQAVSRKIESLNLF